VAGAAPQALRRGDVLTADPGVVATDRMLIDLRAVAAKLPARARLHLGTDAVDVTIRRVPARSTAAILVLERATATFAGDRGVLREAASSAIVAGARVLDPLPVRGISRRRMTAERLTALAAALEGGSTEPVAAARLDLHGALAGPSRLALAPDVEEALASAAIEAVAAHHGAAPLSAGLPLARARAAVLRRLRSLATIERGHAQLATSAVAAVLDDLVTQGRLARSGETVHDPARGSALPPELVAAMDRLEAALSVAAPPPLEEAAAAAGCPPEGVRTLVAEGRIVRLGPDLAWSAGTYQGLAGLALERARATPLTPAAYRDATGTSRKYVMAILEDLDRRGILERTPAGHVPGPRAPRSSPA
jgi:selenocysteine-specific elongation factor